jgi:hypothetical protein
MKDFIFKIKYRLACIFIGKDGILESAHEEYRKLKNVKMRKEKNENL